MKTNLIQDYKIFEGRYHKQMPLLIQEGFQPLTSKDVMEYRIKAIQSKNKNEIDFWLNRYFDTADGLAYYDDSLIVVPNLQELLNINQDSKLRNRSLALSPEQYNQLSKEHEIIKRDKIISGEPLIKEQAKQHPIWLKLAQEDKSLLNEYADAIFAEEKEVYYFDKNMGIYLPNDQDKPSIRAWCLKGLHSGSYADASHALNSDYLDYRLLGMCPQNLEKLVK